MDANKCDRTAVSKLPFESDKGVTAGYILRIHSDFKCSNPEHRNVILDDEIMKKYYSKNQEPVTCLLKYHAL